MERDPPKCQERSISIDISSTAFFVYLLLIIIFSWYHKHLANKNDGHSTSYIVKNEKKKSKKT